MNRLHRRTYAEVDLRRLEANFVRLKNLLPAHSFVCPMVKANAYGHGDLEVARCLELNAADWLGVALVEEGVRLREGGIRTPILLFGIFEDFSAETILDYGLTPVVSDWSQLESLEIRAESPVKIHLKFNTGMNRLGFESDQAPRLRAWLDTHPKLQLQGVATHLFNGDDAGLPRGESESQLVLFEQILGSFKGLNFQAHILNSSAAVTVHARAGKTAGGNWSHGMRPGIALYGAKPASREKLNVELEPVLAWRSHLVLTRRLQAGQKVSYGGVWTSQKPSLIGVVPVGYGDGYSRHFSGKAEVLCRGIRAPVVGTVCMDFMMVDLTNVEAKTGVIAPGEEITLLGDQQGAKIAVEELATWAGTISYEILTSISGRVPRHYSR